MVLLNLYNESFKGLSRNIWILALASFINRAGSMVLLFASLYFTKELGYGLDVAGLIMGFYGVGSILGSYVGGWFTDRISPSKIMIFSQVFSGLILMSILLNDSKYYLISVIFLYALSSDMFRPANSVSIADNSNEINRARSFSLVRLAVNLGFSIGPAVGGIVALKFGYSWLFIIDGFTSIGAGFMLWRMYDRKITHKKKEKLSFKNPDSLSAYKDFNYLFFILLTALYGVCFFQIFASVPQYFSRELKYGEDVIGYLMALNGFLVVVIEMPLVKYLEKHKNTFKYIVYGVLCLPVCFLVLMNGGKSYYAAVIYTFIITMSEIYAMPFMMNFALSKPPDDRKGQYSALYSIAYGISNIVAPVAGLGIAEHFGFRNMFIFLILLSFICMAGFLYMMKQQKYN